MRKHSALRVGIGCTSFVSCTFHRQKKTRVSGLHDEHVCCAPAHTATAARFGLVWWRYYSTLLLLPIILGPAFFMARARSSARRWGVRTHRFVACLIVVKLTIGYGSLSKRRGVIQYQWIPIHSKRGISYTIPGRAYKYMHHRCAALRIYEVYVVRATLFHYSRLVLR